MKSKTKVDRNKKTVSFEGLCKAWDVKGRFAATSLNDMRRAGRKAAKALKNI